MLNQLPAVLEKLRATKPIVLNLTNVVTMDFMANCLLALGASPIMSCDEDEFEALIKISHAVNINIGTLDSAFIRRAERAVALATLHHKPIILDPVGAGASQVRTSCARTLMAHADIIRANGSEIMALIDENTKTAGVESTESSTSAQKSAVILSQSLDCTVVISGAEDYVVQQEKQVALHYGSPLMTRVTGMGCAMTAVIAAFRGVIHDSFTSAALATAYFGACGAQAALEANAPGTFRSLFIDSLYQPNLSSLMS